MGTGRGTQHSAPVGVFWQWVQPREAFAYRLCLFHASCGLCTAPPGPFLGWGRLRRCQELGCRASMGLGGWEDAPLLPNLVCVQWSRSLPRGRAALPAPQPPALMLWLLSVAQEVLGWALSHSTHNSSSLLAPAVAATPNQSQKPRVLGPGGDPRCHATTAHALLPHRLLQRVR